MYLELTISSQAPIYDPEEFKVFCISAGANTIFDTVLAAVTTERHSEDRVSTRYALALPKSVIGYRLTMQFFSTT